MNEELLEIAREWSLEQLNSYIHKLEIRVEYTSVLITQLKGIRRIKSRKLKKILDNGPRGGM